MKTILMKDNLNPKQNFSSAAPAGATEVAPAGGARETIKVVAPDPEVPSHKCRRRFTVQYKLRILQEADQCAQAGQIGGFCRP